jgi:hypothetical protein
MDEQRTVIAIQENPLDSFQRGLADFLVDDVAVPYARGNDLTDIEAQRRRKLHELFDGAEVVDLVGHSTPIKRHLKLGDWVLNPGEASRLASYLPASVKCVRLIGCATASTQDGRDAVQSLARSGLVAAGTRHNVYMTHFDKNGVKRKGGRG